VRIEIRLFATLERYLPPGSRAGAATLDVPEGSTASDVAQRLGIPPGLERVLLINGHEATPDRTLAAGDVLDLYPPLAGGSDRARQKPGASSVSARRICELISAPTSRARLDR
jgi:sulfur-carrier protein